jgi:hypothetical protein
LLFHFGGALSTTRYADSGTLPIDNNPVENTIRPIAVGKKNLLFAGSEGLAAALPRYKACLPLPNSMASNHCAGSPIRSKNCQPAPIAKSTPCYRLQSLPSPKRQW